MSAPRQLWVLGTLVLCALAPVAQAVEVSSRCQECHSEVTEALDLPVVHPPFGDQECSSCHNPHASRHANLLRQDTSTLCESCHDGIQAELDLPHVHSPAASGDCTGCHDPHASRNAGLLRKTSPGLCGDCHQQVAEWQTAAVVHPPVEDGCNTCHAPHASEGSALLETSRSELCASCHDDSDVESAHEFPNIVGSDCTVCHDPHASSQPGLLRANEHPPFAEGKCSLCHDKATEGSGFAVAKVEVLCSRCHSEAQEFEQLAFRHILERPNSCVTCHNPHASNATHLLISDETQLCTTCHFPDAAKAEHSPLTHPGVECGECHLPHGADNDRYLKEKGQPALCATCHDAAAHSSHPVGEKVIDPRTKVPVTCLSCHQLHGAPYEKYLPLDPDRELCIQCHRK